MMDWDRTTQTGARTPGVRAVPGPILRYRCGLRSQTQCWGFFCGRLIDTKDGDKLEAHFAHAGSELKRMAHRKVPSDMHIFQPYWGKPAVRNDREGRGNVGIIRSPVRATILLACGGRRVIGVPTATLVLITCSMRLLVSSTYFFALSKACSTCS